MTNFYHSDYAGTLLDRSLVDGTPWFKICCNPRVSEYIYTMEDGWYCHVEIYYGYSIFDVDEHVYTLLLLKFPTGWA